MNIVFSITAFLFLVHGTCPGCVTADTSKPAAFELAAGLSFAVNNSFNWNGLDGNNFLLLTDITFLYSNTTSNSTHLYNLKFDLGFTYHYDSLWNKHADILRAQYILKAGTASFSHTFTSLFNTHFLNSYNYMVDPATGITQKRQTESVFNPSQLEIGLGSGYTFLKQSVINVSLATARLRLLPEPVGSAAGECILLGVIASGMVYFDYGFSIQYYLTKTLGGKAEFKGNGKMFIKGFRRDQFDMDFSNVVLVRLTKYLRLKTEIKMIYAPTVSFKPQYYHELLMGFYYNPSF